MCIDGRVAKTNGFESPAAMRPCRKLRGARERKILVSFLLPDRSLIDCAVSPQFVRVRLIPRAAFRCRAYVTRLEGCSGEKVLPLKTSPVVCTNGVVILYRTVGRDRLYRVFTPFDYMNSLIHWSRLLACITPYPDLRCV